LTNATAFEILVASAEQAADIDFSFSRPNAMAATVDTTPMTTTTVSSSIKVKPRDSLST